MGKAYPQETARILYPNSPRTQSFLEPGRRVIVNRKYKGFEIRMAFCGHCSITFNTSQIPAYYFARPPNTESQAHSSP